YALDLRKLINWNHANTQEAVYPGEPDRYQNAAYLFNQKEEGSSTKTTAGTGTGAGTGESNETNHFTIMDSEGNTISSTQTINGLMGSGVVVGGTGIVLNNQMDDFTSKVGGRNHFGAIGGYNNLITPEKRPLSSMSPTIVFEKTKSGLQPILALGTAAGTRILTCVTQTILNYLDFKLPLDQAVLAVRYHQQWYPDEIRIDGKYLPESTINILEQLGHKIHYEDLDCRIQAIAREGTGPSDIVLHGVSDPRGGVDCSARGI
ncbi:MAG: gamma-glutamyltransferase, partial [Oligoflexia bacterium]|nr:gamma-glutamyltransferase [Oligoflexia bacterium]